MSFLTITINGVSREFESDKGIESLKEEFRQAFGDHVAEIDSIEGDITLDEIDALSDVAQIKIGTIKGNFTI